MCSMSFPLAPSFRKRASVWICSAKRVALILPSVWPLLFLLAPFSFSLARSHVSQFGSLGRAKRSCCETSGADEALLCAACEMFSLFWVGGRALLGVLPHRCGDCGFNLQSALWVRRGGASSVRQQRARRPKHRGFAVTWCLGSFFQGRFRPVTPGAGA